MTRFRVLCRALRGVYGGFGFMRLSKSAMLGAMRAVSVGGVPYPISELLNR